MKNGLEKANAQIEKEGLPSTDVMRARLEGKSWQEFLTVMKAKFAEYTGLFNRFKSGEDLTGAEIQRMADLSDEFQRLEERERAK